MVMPTTNWHNATRFLTAIDDLNIDTSDTYEWVPGGPAALIRVGFHATTAVVHNSAACLVTMTLRTIAGTGGSVVDTMQVVANGATLAANSGVYRDIVRPVAQATAEDGSLRDVGPSGPIIVDNPNGSVLFTVSVAAASGAGKLWLEYVMLPWAGANIPSTYTKDVT